MELAFLYFFYLYIFSSSTKIPPFMNSYSFSGKGLLCILERSVSFSSEGIMFIWKEESYIYTLSRPILRWEGVLLIYQRFRKPIISPPPSLQNLFIQKDDLCFFFVATTA
ncbi:hypothetical protein QBC43DRAFT_19775 [Cladorrhinum sp. PSN259]|nr:hypothetical protein QBC43DRAFT_19775 [Cladorrhinum sp. PSN259]